VTLRQRGPGLETEADMSGAEMVGLGYLDHLGQTRHHRADSDLAADDSRENWLKPISVVAGRVTCEGNRSDEVVGTPMKAH